jgi:phage head maturation protease
MNDFVRSYLFEDAKVTPGDGRTVEAFTAVFGVETEVRDQHGHYRELNERSAFNKTIADNGTRFGVFYNHARTVHGTPSDLFSLPLGVPVSPPRVETLSVDGRSVTGLLTVTRYNKTDLGEQVLEGIRSGSIPGYSYSGRFVRSDPGKAPRGGWRANTDGTLQLVRRSEIAMREYGPTPLPVYEDATVVGVRSLADRLGTLNESDRAALVELLTRSTQHEPDGGNGTPSGAAEGNEPRNAHSGLTASQRARIGLITRGVRK